MLAAGTGQRRQAHVDVRSLGRGGFEHQVEGHYLVARAKQGYDCTIPYRIVHRVRVARRAQFVARNFVATLIGPYLRDIAGSDGSKLASR